LNKVEIQESLPKKKSMELSDNKVSLYSSSSKKYQLDDISEEYLTNSESRSSESKQLPYLFEGHSSEEKN